MPKEKYGKWFAIQASIDDGQSYTVASRKDASGLYVSFYRAGRRASWRRNVDGTYTVRAIGLHGARYKKGPRKDLREAKTKDVNNKTEKENDNE